ncbi:HDIG domain-containing protein [Geovibrio thiophilus]|uniref:HDIG domain-containing protein n=1 Tax=Geovibrio thiophilus TaxID=139438 RepID=A0A3R5UX20_9BACT|nr:HD domain-containing protein [Geovibrio thiophilus]QAR32549.1 HDIG domain-containing protein [Geovibrio thiophilus]
MELNRESAYALLTEYTKSDSLLKHALSVEQAMRAYARRLGGDEEKWGIAGLIHDFDYEQFPTLEDHPYKGCEILREKGWTEDIIRAVMSHGEHTGVTRETPMEKALFAVDELCGFLLACAYVRPDRKISMVEVKSVKKKLKDKSFARAVNREDIAKGIEELGVEADEHIRFVIDALSEISDELGL